MMGGGYLRRKITYNLGKGGKGSTGAGKDRNGGEAELTSFNPLDWFVDNSTNDGDYAVIIENEGMVRIDLAYADIGVNEGWLKKTGCHTDENDNLIWQYHHVTPG